MAEYPKHPGSSRLKAISTVMRAEQKAAVAEEVRRRAALQVVDDLEAQLARARGGKLRLEDSANLSDVSAIMISRGAQLLEDLARNAPDLHVRALCADRLAQRGIELQRAIADGRPERDAAGPQRVLVVRAEDMDAIEHSLTEGT